MVKEVYLFIVDSDRPKAKKRQIWVYDDLDAAIEAKDEYLAELTKKYPRNTLTVVQTLAREYIARLQVPSRGTLPYNVCNYDHDRMRHPDFCPFRRDYFARFILRIETGTLMSEMCPPPEVCEHCGDEDCDGECVAFHPCPECGDTDCDGSCVIVDIDPDP